MIGQETGRSSARKLIRDVGVITIFLVALNLLWRAVRYGLGFPIWGDEAFVVTSLYLRDFPGMVEPLEYGQIVPLGFMWAELAAARALGLSQYALRLLPFLAGIASMLLFYRLAKRLFTRWGALLAAAVFAASYYPVRHAAEVKPYAADLLVSLILTYLTVALSANLNSRRRWAALIAFATVGVWLSYPAVFVAGGVAIYLLYEVLRKAERPLLAPVAAYGLFVGGSFLAAYVMYARPHAEAAAFLREIRTWKDAFPPISRPWLLPWWFIKVHTGRLLAYPVGGKNSGSTATFLLVAAGCVKLCLSGRGGLLLLLLGPLALMFPAAALKLYPYGTSARVAQHMAPAFCLLAGLGLATVLKLLVRRRHAPNAFRIAALVLAGIATAGIAMDIRTPYKKEATRLRRDAVRSLAEAGWGGDQWVFFLALDKEALPRAPDVRPFGGSGAAVRYYARIYLPPDRVNWAPPVGAIEPRARGRIFFVIYRDNKYRFTSSDQEKLQDYLAALEERFGGPCGHEFYNLWSEEDPGRGQVERLEVYKFHPPREED